MRSLVLGLLALAAGLPRPSVLSAQSRTGEWRVQALAGLAPSVSRRAGNQEPMDPPDRSTLAGGITDISFITGHFRLGPEAFVLRGAHRRVWSLGGVARYEFGEGSLRPYALFAAGAYWWDRDIVIDVPPTPSFHSWGSDVNLLSASVGGGLTLGSPVARVSGVVELRAHRTLQRDELTGARALFTLGLGGRIAW